MEKLVVVASTNPVKIECVRKAFSAMMPATAANIVGLAAASGVPDQPMSDEETFLGAQNRASDARKKMPGADFWIGIEGGISDGGGLMEAFAWILVDSTAGTSRARTATFILPAEVAELVRKGMELGAADDLVFGRSNSKQKDGAVGLLTGGVINRLEYYSHAVVLALIPFANTQLFGSHDINP